MFASCYGLGLRVGEAARLHLQDIDWDRCVLTIHQTKFAKSRLVPFGPKLAARLNDYVRQREARVGRFGLQEWIAAGKPLQFDEVMGSRRYLLEEAIRTGFHSVVEVLLA